MKPNVILRKRLTLLLGLVALTAVLSFSVAYAMLGSPGTPSAAATPVPTEMPRREISGDAKSPAISFIDSASPTCTRPVVGTGACYIQWDYLYVTAAAGEYIISMTVTIDDQLRAYHTGFFQSNIYIPAPMTTPGYKVTCGLPEGSDTAVWGNSYSYAIRARETSGLTAANYGSVACPADVVQLFLPVLQKP